MKKPQSLVHWLFIFSPVLICVLIMLPRLFSAQFGLLDDGNTISVSQSIQAGTWHPGWENNSGRFRPTYWLYYAMIYTLVGNNPVGFFLSHTVLLSATTALLICLVLIAGRSGLQAWLTGVLFAISGPVIENFYTLSKDEPIQVFCMVAGLLFIVLFGRTTSIWKKVLYFLGALIVIQIAWLAKETTLALVPISVGWLLIGWGIRKFHLGEAKVSLYLVAMAAIFITGLIFFLLRSYYIHVGITEMGYSSQYSLQIKAMLATGLSYVRWLIRDFLYMVPLVVWLGYYIIRKRRLDKLSWYLDMVIWMVAWFIIFLPWIYVQEYYLYPLTVGSVVFAGLAMSQLINSLRDSSKSDTAIAEVCLVVSSLLFGILFLNNITAARIQLTVDSANKEVVDFLAKNTPVNGQVLVNLYPRSEYIPEIKFHLVKLYQRSDINVSLFVPDKLVKASQSIIVSPDIDNQPLLTVRLGFPELDSDHRNKSLQGYLGAAGTPVLIIERKFWMFNVDLPQLFCPFFKSHQYCSQGTNVIDHRELIYRWLIYSYPAGHIVQEPTTTTNK